VDDLIRWLAGRGETYAHAFETPRVIRAAIDHAHVKSDTMIAGAGEIAFFPPMTGGIEHDPKSMPSGLTRGCKPVFPRDKREAFARRSCSIK